MDELEYRREDERGRRAVEQPPEAAATLSPAEQLASNMGNSAFARIARGGGILPDGRAHPDVEATIAQTRGSGRPLDDGSRERLGASLEDPLTDVRVHSDGTANALADSVSARAFATGSDIYFAHGEYRPGSSDGDRLLAHEVAHVAQQRGAPSSGPLVVSNPGDALETEAEGAVNELVD